MTIGANNLEEEVAAIKGTLERLTKESKDKEAHINLQEEKIAKLTIKMEKWLALSFTKGSESEDKKKESIQTKTFDEGVHSKKGDKLKNG